MEHLIVGAAIEIIISILAPMITVSIIIVRYLWKKEQYYTLMKQRMDFLAESDEKSGTIHNVLYDKINQGENRIIALETKMDLIIKHFDIKGK